MPELPEVETVRRTLEPLLTGRRVASLRLLRPEVIAHPRAGEFAARVPGLTIAGLFRRGKYLRLSFLDGSSLAVHLRMTGRLLHTAAGEPLKPHTHVIFALEDGSELRFSDVRRFGRLWLLAPGEADEITGISRLGPEPFDPACGPDYYQNKLSSRRAAVKCCLLDQMVVAGLGNIYADEALFAAGIDPRRPACTLTEAEWKALAAAIPQVLSIAIAHRGTTFHDFLDGEGREGGNRPHLQAYGRAGQPCPRCGTVMERLVVGGRGSTVCTKCQK